MGDGHSHRGMQNVPLLIPLSKSINQGWCFKPLLGWVEVLRGRDEIFEIGHEH